MPVDGVMNKSSGQLQSITQIQIHEIYWQNKLPFSKNASACAISLLKNVWSLRILSFDLFVFLCIYICIYFYLLIIVQ